MDYSKHLSGNVRADSTTSDRVDPRQRQNHSGGYVFTVSPLERLERFLIVGTEGGTYYQGERELTRENALALSEVLDVDPAAAVRTIVEISQWGRAPKQSPGIFALAVAASHQTGKDPLRARTLALDAVPLVCRTGGTFLEFVRYVVSMRGRGTALRRALGQWYARLPADSLFWQTFKYRSRGSGRKGSAGRNAWTHRDVLRAARPEDAVFDPAQRAVVRYLVGGASAVTQGRKLLRRAADWTPENPSTELRREEGSLGQVPELIQAFEDLQAAETEAHAAQVIDRYGLPHEMVPDRYKKSPVVWESLFPRLPLGALVKNLGLLTHLGLLEPTDGTGVARLHRIFDRLRDPMAMRKSRLHPVAFLVASRAYAHGEPIEAKKYSRRRSRSGELGQEREVMRWNPVAQLVSEVETGFYRAFGNVQPSGVRLDLCIDISGSMSGARVVGMPDFSARQAAAAMALVQAQTEPRAQFWGFCTTYQQLDIERDWSIAQACEYMARLPMEGTDCSLPFREAERAGREVEGFAVYTDSETNGSRQHPHLALQRYRQATGIPARLAVMAFSATEFTIADPKDAGMMDFVGFDAAGPSLLADFLRGKRVSRRQGEEEGEE